MGRSFPSKRSSTGVASTRRHAIEPLERRTLLSSGPPAAGRIDPTFGVNGTVRIFANDVSGQAVAMESVVQADNKILVLGGAPGPEASIDGVSHNDVALARLTADGALDATFGQGGVTLTDLGSDQDIAFGAAIQPDGKIVVLTTRKDGRTFLLRYKPDGALDRTFASDGVLDPQAVLGRQRLKIQSVAALSDGNVVAPIVDEGSGQFLVTRFTSGGALDLSLAGVGYYAVSLPGYATRAAVEADGTVVAAGVVYQQGSYWPEVVRYIADGSLDTTFHSDLYAKTVIRESIDFVTALPDGRIWVVGESFNRYQATALRLNTDGSLDTSWSGDGVLALDPPGQYLASIFATSDGKLLGATIGDGRNDAYTRSTLFRFAADGSYDAQFGNAGLVQHFGAPFYDDVDLQSDGKLIATGRDFTVDRREAALFAPEPPRADAGGPYSVAEGDHIALSGAKSTDIDGYIQSYEWDFDYDGVTFTPDALGADVDFSAADLDDGTRTVALRVTDDDGDATIAAVPVTIINTPPDASFVGAHDADEGAPYSLTLRASDPGPDTITQWTIDWGDGLPPQTLPGNAKLADHVFADGPATRHVQATVTDEDGTWPASPSGVDPHFGFGVARDINRVSDATLIIQPDEAIVYTANGGRQIRRSRPNGYDDYDFGAFGVAEQVLGSPQFEVLAVQPDGKILAGGTIVAPQVGPYNRFVVARFTAEGRLDLTFNGVGYATIDVPGGTIRWMAVQPDGEIFVAGEQQDSRIHLTMARLNADGTIDAGFGDGGIAPSNLYVSITSSSVFLRPDGKIGVSTLEVDGPAETALTARFNADGSPDETYGQAGRAALSQPAGAVQTAIALPLADGKTLVAIGGGDRALGPITLLRLDVDGAIDRGFGIDGLQTLGNSRSSNFPTALQLDPAGRIIVTGSNPTGVFVARVSVDGEIITPPRLNTNDPAQPVANLPNALATAVTSDGDLVVLTYNGSSIYLYDVRRFNFLDSLRVNDVPPKLTLSGEASVFAGGDYVLRLRADDVPGDPILSWRIDWGDGVISPADGGATTVEHVYTTAGHQVITATATDKDGDFVATREVYVVPPPTLTADGTLEIIGSPGDDAFDISAADGLLSVKIDGHGPTYAIGDVKRIHVAALDGFDVVTISGVLPESMFDLGDGIDSLTVMGTGGDDTLDLSGAGFTLNGVAAATFAGLENVSFLGGDGADRGVVHLDVAGCPNLKFDGGPGVDELTALSGGGDGNFSASFQGDRLGIYSTTGQPFSADYAATESVTVRGSAGRNWFSLVAPAVSSAELNLYGGEGDDRLEMSSVAGGPGGSLFNLTAVHFHGGGGNDLATLVDDSNIVPGAKTYSVDGAAVSVEGGGRVTYDGVESVRLIPTDNALFHVTPAQSTQLIVDGSFNAPGRAEVTLAGATGARGPLAVGRYTFDNRQPIELRGIRLINDILGPTTALSVDADQGIVRAAFNEPIAADTVQIGDLTVRNADTGGSLVPTNLNYDPGSRVATFAFEPFEVGTYEIVVPKGAVADLSGNPTIDDFRLTFEVLPPTRLVGRALFYNNSVFDDHDPAATTADYLAARSYAVPWDGNTPSSVANTTSYSKGINGLLLEFDGVPPTDLTAADLEFRVGRGGDPAGWAVAPAPLSVTLLPSDGTPLTRYAVIWADGAIVNTWLLVTVKASDRVQIHTPQTFAFGNLIGDTADDFNRLAVSAADLVRTRNTIGQPAGFQPRFDFNLDGAINAADLVIVRNNVGRFLTPIVPKSNATAARRSTTAASLVIPRSNFVSPFGERRIVDLSIQADETAFV